MRAPPASRRGPGGGSRSPFAPSRPPPFLPFFLASSLPAAPPGRGSRRAAQAAPAAPLPGRTWRGSAESMAPGSPPSCAARRGRRAPVPPGSAPLSPLPLLSPISSVPPRSNPAPPAARSLATRATIQEGGKKRNRPERPHRDRAPAAGRADGGAGTRGRGRSGRFGRVRLGLGEVRKDSERFGWARDAPRAAGAARRARWPPRRPPPLALLLRPALPLGNI